MDSSSILFALGSLMVGIWLIFVINGDFKEKRRGKPATGPMQPAKPAPVKRARPTAGGAHSLSSLRQPVVPAVKAGKASPAGAERGSAAGDRLESLDAAAVRETFERFRHEP